MHQHLSKLLMLLLCNLMDTKSKWSKALTSALLINTLLCEECPCLVITITNAHLSLIVDFWI